MRRRSVLVMGPGLAAASGMPRTAWAQGGFRVRLPAPTGGHGIGTVAVHLIDRSRPDPWVTAQPYRELMVSIWYPAMPTGHPVAAHMEPGAAERFDALVGPGHGIAPGTVDWAATRTHAREGAPADAYGERRPVVLYSAGAGDPRTWGTVWVEELASRGCVVVTIDHTYESPGVQFPDGSVKDNDPLFEVIARAEREGTIPALLEKVLRVRVEARKRGEQ